MEIRGYYDLENFVRLMLGNFVRECHVSLKGMGEEEEEVNFTYIMGSEKNGYSAFMKEVGNFAKLSYTIGIEEVDFRSHDMNYNTVAINGYYF